LISSPTWGNKIRVFDSVRFDIVNSCIHSTLFGGHLVKFKDDHFNRSSNNEQLTGFYNVIKPCDGVSIDLYLANRRKKSTGEDGGELTDDRSSAGFRLNFSRESREADFEYVYQFGDDKRLDIDAYAAAFFFRQDLDCPLDPWVKLELNIASGDNNPDDSRNGTFQAPYQTMHGPYGIIDYFKWQNMKEIALVASLNPAGSLRIQPELHWFWLESTNDYWYRSNGKPLFSRNSFNESYAGSEASLIAKIPVTDRIKLEAGYSAFFPGDAPDDISDGTVHYGYLQAELSF
jgi:hypothetical protein